VPYIHPRGAPERASRLGHVRTAMDPSVRQALESYFLPPAVSGPPPIAGLLVEAATLPVSGLPEPAYAISIDGSKQEVEVRPEFPSARVGFAQVAGVFSQLDALAPAPPGGFVDPVTIARATRAALVKGVVPTSIVTIRSGQTIHEAWREAVWELFTTCELEGPAGTNTRLADVLAHVLGTPTVPVSSVTLERCPGRHDRDCDALGVVVPLGGATCEKCGTALYLTDATKTHEEVVEFGSNDNALGRLMLVLELLTFLWQIRIFSMVDPGRVFPRCAFLLDGPLAMFGRPAGLKRDALRFLQAIHAQEVAVGRAGLPVVIGIEKGGALAEHAEHIREHIPPGYLLCLPDRYIREHVQHYEGKREYGYDTDYGRRFIYRAGDGRTLVFSMPPMPSGDPTDDAATVDLAHYPSLDTAIGLLDQVGTMLYRNAVIPVAFAHNYASLPLGTGSQVLTYLAQDALGAARTQVRLTPFF
jgi:NurA domain